MPKVVSLPEQIVAARREVGLRERVYPRWIAAGKMTQEKADAEIAAMKAILATLIEVDNERNPELLG